MTDESLVLLPSSRTIILDRATQTKIIGALCTRFTTATPSIIRQALQDNAQEWAKFRILGDGDTMRAAALDTPMRDRRNASYVRVRPLHLIYFSVHSNHTYV